MTTIQNNYEIFREKFLDGLSKLPDAPVMLSGGVDSATILAGLLELGKTPDVITFQLGEYQSPDVIVAKSMCETLKLPHCIVKIPQSDETLKSDIKRLVNIIGTTKRLHVQCAHPFLYVCPTILDLGYHEVLAGFALDHICGMGRYGEQCARDNTPRAFTELRIRGIEDMTQTSTDTIPKLCASYGIKILDPYRVNKDFISWGVLLSWDEMHKPFQKAIAVKAFPDFWKKGKWYRKHASYQIVSGIRDWHVTLDQERVRSCKNLVESQRTMRTTYKKVMNDEI